MGAVNIFLGGTGKYVAEDIQDNLDFYRRMQISEPIAFDLDGASDHTGVNLQDRLVVVEEETTANVKNHAVSWSALRPGVELAPANGSSRRSIRCSVQSAKALADTLVRHLASSRFEPTAWRSSRSSSI